MAALIRPLASNGVDGDHLRAGPVARTTRFRVLRVVQPAADVAAARRIRMTIGTDVRRAPEPQRRRLVDDLIERRK